MLRIVKDNVKSLREKCAPVEMPLSKNDEKLLLEMLDYLKKSQDDDYAEKLEQQQKKFDEAGRQRYGSVLL